MRTHRLLAVASLHAPPAAALNIVDPASTTRATTAIDIRENPATAIRTDLGGA